MSVLKRAKRIFAQSWDEMCERFKDPEADMQNALEGIDRSLSDLRHTAALRITDGKLIEKQVNELQEGKEEWGKKAEAAVDAGQDDLARRALRLKKKYNSDLSSKLYELELINEEISELKQEIKKGEIRFTEFKNKARLMQHNKIFAKTGVSRVKSNIENVENLEEKFKQLEASAELKEMTEQSDLDDELKALKNKIKSQKKKEK